MKKTAICFVIFLLGFSTNWIFSNLNNSGELIVKKAKDSVFVVDKGNAAIFLRRSGNGLSFSISRLPGVTILDGFIKREELNLDFLRRVIFKDDSNIAVLYNHFGEIIEEVVIYTREDEDFFDWRDYPDLIENLN